jgi:hypothetical protein
MKQLLRVRGEVRTVAVPKVRVGKGSYTARLPIGLLAIHLIVFVQRFKNQLNSLMEFRIVR